MTLSPTRPQDLGGPGAQPPAGLSGAADPKALLTLRDLTVTIGGTRILDGIDLVIGPGETVALTGESGSGKSMTALAVMGLLPRRARAEGSLRLGDTDLLTLPERALAKLRGRDIGMVFQEPMTALNPLQRIGTQVAETIRVHEPATSAADRDARARDALTRAGLPPEAFPPSRYPHELSGGQRQRVVIAMAIVMRPRLLIADEPTTALDVTTQAQILDLLKSLARADGIGLLMITHDLAVVAQMADRIAVMQRGRIVEQNDTAALLSDMRHPYTRDLFRASRHRAAMPPVTPGPPLLEVVQATRTYPVPRTHPFSPRRTATAVDAVSLTIREGERVGLVGQSGCGKSTLTRAILGLDRLQGGTITLGGHSMHAETGAEVRRRLSVVFQDPYGSFNPRHKVGRLIAEPFHLLADPPRGAKRFEAVAAALSEVGLSPEDADKHIHAFSGGQRQRIAIARALIIKPALVVFDEAVSALDVRVRARILDLIASLSRSHRLAYLFISHDLTVVRSITDRVLVMQAGKIVEEGATETVFAAPQHAYTRSLLAAAPRLPDTGETDASRPAD